MRERIVERVGVTVIVLLLIIIVFLYAGRDDKGPAISFASDYIYYDGVNEAILLADVTAYDSKDGDVTSSIMIDNVIVIEERAVAKVVYIAKDSSNNITRVERFVNYSEDIVNSDTNEKNMQESTEDTKDNINENEMENIEMENSGEDVTESSGEEKPENTAEVTESENITIVPESTTVAVSTDISPVMVLEVTEATVSLGSNFRVFDYVEAITDDKDGREELFRQICIDGYYDTNTVGDYEIYIFCVDSDKNSSNKEKFIIHVRKEEQ